MKEAFENWTCDRCGKVRKVRVYPGTGELINGKDNDYALEHVSVQLYSKRQLGEFCKPCTEIVREKLLKILNEKVEANNE